MRRRGRKKSWAGRGGLAGSPFFASRLAPTLVPRRTKLPCGSEPAREWGRLGFKRDSNSTETLPQPLPGKLLDNKIHERPGLARQQFVLGVIDRNIAIIDIPVR